MPQGQELGLCDMFAQRHGRHPIAKLEMGVTHDWSYPQCCVHLIFLRGGIDEIESTSDAVSNIQPCAREDVARQWRRSGNQSRR